MSTAAKEIYFYEVPVAGRKVRALSMAGFNLLRKELGLPVFNWYEWKHLPKEKKSEIRHETFRLALPALTEKLFGEKIDEFTV